MKWFYATNLWNQWIYKKICEVFNFRFLLKYIQRDVHIADRQQEVDWHRINVRQQIETERQQTDNI